MEVEGNGRLAGLYYRKMQIYMRKAFKRIGVSFDEGIVLLNVLINPGTTQDRIAEALVLDAAAVARSLKSLEHKGYLVRSIDMDNQRRKLVNVTPTGAKLAEQMDVVMQIWDAKIFQGLDDDQMMALADSLRLLQRRAAEVDVAALIDGQSL